MYPTRVAVLVTPMVQCRRPEKYKDEQEMMDTMQDLPEEHSFETGGMKQLQVRLP